MYFITTKRMLEVCFFQHTPTFIIEPLFFPGQIRQRTAYGFLDDKAALYGSGRSMEGCFHLFVYSGNVCTDADSHRKRFTEFIPPHGKPAKYE